jgi:hypothetical protein
MSFAVEIDEQTEQQIVALFDVATKAGGLQTANVALGILGKFAQAKEAAKSAPELPLGKPEASTNGATAH